ncbi:single-stranded DNA-binding protein [Spirillospora sp. NPDC048911]|uniref:single-stranded DNA-binding protein n=1 Tax=Spirillospora sp. NPDC048911 TaxID=3364527 RepID=UPI0037214236
MNEAQVTVVGWIAAEPFYTITGNGTPFLSLRVGCTPRRFDRQAGLWKDVDTLFLTVNCWRQLADNVNASEFKRGYPVVVTGRLRIRQYEKDGGYRFSAEIEAGTLGHDLSRGTADFRPVQRNGALSEEDRQVAQNAADHWAVAGPLTAPDPAVPAAAGRAGSGAEAIEGSGASDSENGSGRDNGSWSGSESAVTGGDETQSGSSEGDGGAEERGEQGASGLRTEAA